MTTFHEWLNHQQPKGSELATTSSRTTKTKRDRDRLARMETMLRELMHTKEIIAGRTRHGNA